MCISDVGSLLLGGQLLRTCGYSEAEPAAGTIIEAARYLGHDGDLCLVGFSRFPGGMGPVRVRLTAAGHM